MKLETVIVTNKMYGLISEYNKSITLKRYLNLNTLKLSKIKFIFQQILNSFKICHDKFIAHRDIKLDNIIINSNLEVSVIDFGYSTKVITPLDKKSTRFCGTPLYMAPNVISKQIHDRNI